MPGAVSPDAAPVVPISLADLRSSLTVDRSNLNSYHITGLVWVERQPLLVNRDFDFGTAMGIEDVGPAIAAGKRATDNKATAASLATMVPLDLDQHFLQAIRRCGDACRNFWVAIAEKGNPVALFGLLYGGQRQGPTVRLQTVLEIRSPRESSSAGENATQGTEKPQPMRLIRVSQARPLSGDGGWTTSSGEVLVQTIQSAVEGLAAWAPLYFPTLLSAAASPSEAPQVPREPVRCPIGDGGALVGTRVGDTVGAVVMLVNDIPKTLAVCQDFDAPAPQSPDQPPD